ncbi:MAG: NADH-quinone oxidoreductase subunit NuoE [Pseudomonadota bacterium]
MEAEEKKIIDGFIKKHAAVRNAVIGILQDIQQHQGYVSEAAVRYVSSRLAIPASQVFSVVTFYGTFSLTPQGRNHVHVCQGTACHIKGGAKVGENMARKLKIKPGETTADGKFSLHQVRCLGCCALAPVVKVNSDIYASVSQDQLSSILELYT